MSLNARRTPRKRRSRRRLSDIPQFLPSSETYSRTEQALETENVLLPDQFVVQHAVGSGTAHCATEIFPTPVGVGEVDIGIQVLNSNMGGASVEMSSVRPTEQLDVEKGFPSEGNMLFPDDVFDEEPCDEVDEEMLRNDNEETVHLSMRTGRELLNNDLENALSSVPTMKIPNWRVLWSLIMTNGSRRLTKDSYQSVRNFMEAIPDGSGPSCQRQEAPFSAHTSVQDLAGSTNSLPHYSTLHKTYKPRLLSSLAVRGNDSQERVDLSKPGARNTSKSSSREAQTTVRTIMPSEYAREDVASPNVWRELCSTSLTLQETSTYSPDCIDTMPIVRARDWFYGPKKAISVDSNAFEGPYTDFAEVGDVVDIHLLQSLTLVEAVQRCFAVHKSTASSCGPLRGTVCHTWSVKHSKRSSDPTCYEEHMYTPSSRDCDISNSLRFQKYISPLDSVAVEIPKIPVEEELDAVSEENIERPKKRKKRSLRMEDALKKRRAAIKERRKQEFMAWENWEKPLLKPGDFVALIKPILANTGPAVVGRSESTLLTVTDKQSRLCVVHRFWTEQEEKSIHVFYISGGTSSEELQQALTPSNVCSPLCDAPTKLFIDVRSLGLVNTHGGKRGPQRYTPISSEGVLPSGERYFIYRFILFWDGFQIQAGKKASGEGIYMLCMNLPPVARASPKAVRILSLVPPGVKTAAILNRILPDIIEGMTTGFVDVDADGIRRRIFLDLLGCLGDTPALNSVLDVLGHTAVACCHLCRYTRASSTMIGSKYTSENGLGCNTAASRGFLQHEAVHDCGAKRENCRRLGITHDPDPSTLPLHSFRAALFEARGRIPVTTTGVQLLSHQFDPYRACFIAPDHLVTGHTRDTINLAYCLLPSAEYRKAVEEYMMDFLAEAGFPSQTRLFDADKKALHSMSMTDTYALGMIAELAFVQACASQTEAAGSSPTLRDSTSAAVAIVGSCADFIAKLWRRPELPRDGPISWKQFLQKDGMEYVSNIQELVGDHLSKLRQICTLPDACNLALEHPDLPTDDRVRISARQRDCFRAIKVLDKPNVHRLRELVHTTLPMLGHVCLFGELVLEKAHQSLKRVVKRSNNKNVHILSLQSVAIDDWQGRLTAAIPGVQRGDSASFLHCLRLFSGRELVATLNGSLPAQYKEQVIKTIGPNQCIQSELYTQGKSVLSPRTATHALLSWKMQLPSESLPPKTSYSQQIENNIYFQLQIAFRDEPTILNGRMGDYITSVHPGGAPGPSFRRGDIVETICFRPTDVSSHHPFLLQTNCLSYLEFLAVHSAPCLWFVEKILFLKSKRNEITHYVAVRPCSRFSDPSAEERLQYNLQKYTPLTNSPISFGMIDASMRKVGKIRVRTKHSTWHKDQDQTSAVCGFYALTRTDGYPGRQG